MQWIFLLIQSCQKCISWITNCCQISFLFSTPLHFTAFGGYLDIAKLLVEKNAIVGIKDNYGADGYDHAIENGHMELANYLANNWNTFTMFLFQKKNIIQGVAGKFQLLIEKNATNGIKNNDGADGYFSEGWGSTYKVVRPTNNSTYIVSTYK